jgi:hypothetical protein
MASLQPEIIASVSCHRLYYKTAIHCLRTSVNLSDRLVLHGEQAPTTTGGGEVGPSPFREYMNHFRGAAWLASPKVRFLLREAFMYQ